MIFKEIAELENGDMRNIVNLLDQCWSAEHSLLLAGQSAYSDMDKIYLGQAGLLCEKVTVVADMIGYEEPFNRDIERRRLRGEKVT